jgi:hypothetical protein
LHFYFRHQENEVSITFTKLFSSITESTVWCEPDSTRIVWITMLAMADRNGRVWGSIPGLANRARVTLQQCENALITFKSPDRYSRTPDHEGRRIEDIDGGWILLNYEKHRAVQDDQSILESKRRYAARRRAEEKAKKVEKVEVDRSEWIQAEAEAEEDKSRGATRARGTRLPALWTASAENLEYCRKTRPDLDPAVVEERFRNYWLSKAGSAGVKLDWNRTWNNWVMDDRGVAAVKKPAVPSYRSRNSV